MGLNEVQKRERSEYLEKNLIITECSQRKPYVFISYASDNWEAVFKSAVVPMQRQYGLRVYADKAFDKVNDKWIVPMLRNARGADVIVAFISQSYIESYACFLELLTAVNNKKQIVFVSLGDQLHLGNTTDLPVIERGAKNEILNQGANISTNTNNTSNDIMRAMKSAYTSMTTLLEQDALSKYDISDAFINFFRDASINRKTIGDLEAVRRTIKSVSREVFDPSLVTEREEKSKAVLKPEQQPVTEPEPAQTAEPEDGPVQEAATVRTAESAPPADPAPVPPAESEPASVPPAESDPAPVPSAEPASAQPADSASGGSGQKNKKPLNLKLIGGIAAAIVVLAVMFSALSGSGRVTDQPYTMTDGKSDEYSGLYTGEWDKKNGWPNGMGTFVLNDSAGTYEGEWVDGVAEGQGTITWDSGNHYEGEWKDGMRSGHGTYTYADGGVYEGEFQDNERSGTGTLTWETEDGGAGIYEGEFKNDMCSGKGTFTWKENGEVALVYEGEFADDEMNGYGTYTWSDSQMTYEGEVKNGKMDGKGILTYSDGSVYEGEFLDNEKNGEGTYTKADGTVVTENWVNGSKIETLTLDSGTYTGSVSNGKPDGQGTMEYTSGQVYEGEWKDGVRSGKGRCTWPDGDYYDGEWADDQCDGQGIFTWENGDFIEAVWKNGRLNGQGTYTWTSGTVGKGRWVDDEWDGEWTFTYADGTVETRMYDHGTRVDN